MAQTSQEGRLELITLVQNKLRLTTRKEAEHLLGVLFECLEVARRSVICHPRSGCNPANPRARCRGRASGTETIVGAFLAL